MSGSGCRSAADNVHFGNAESRRRSRTVVFAVESEFEDVAAQLAFLSLSVLPSKHINVVVVESHCAANFGIKYSLYVGNLLPYASFKVKEPEIIESCFLWSCASIDEDMLGR
jgi:hypothetical protein